jgi:hypothetical protein
MYRAQKTSTLLGVIEDRAQGSVFKKTLKEFELIESSTGIAPFFQWHRTKVVNRGFSRGRESTTGVDQGKSRTLVYR